MFGFEKECRSGSAERHSSFFCFSCRPAVGESRRSRQDGFTLIELLIVVAIIGIISAIATSAILFAMEKSRQNATVNDMGTIAKVLNIYNIDQNTFPPSPTGAMPADNGGPGAIDEILPLMAPWASNALPPQDEWGNNYIYTKISDDEFILESYGKDGADGPADITPDTKNDFTLDIVYNSSRFINSPY